MKNDSDIAMEGISRRFDDSERNVNTEFQEVFRRIDSERAELERNLDRRFDSVHRKIHSNKPMPESEVQA